ncbi:hypothetical protein [Halolamina sp.]|uniref:DUF7563 family protein n=1 Tax=Halolamina sp. TaxID=1940283 RepID=UPI0035649CB8
MDFSAGVVEPGTCQHCGAHVSADFRRTLGDEENVAHRCLACDSTPRLQAGSAAGAKVSYPDPAEQESRNRGSRVAATDGGIAGGEGQ